MNKDEKLKITKDKLIESTSKLMDELENPMEVTSREIAQAAGVKAGMINYCFDSRENLIYQVFQNQYLSYLNEKKVQKIIESDASPKDVLKQLHYMVAKYLLDNPKFTQAITGYKVKKSEAECKLIAYELSTMMQLIIYRKDDLKKDFGIDLSKSKELKHYIDMRIDLLLK